MTSEQNQPGPDCIHYFIDESGDPTLFADKGKVRVGMDGCSKYFILGKLDIDDPASLAKDIEELRRELLTDPYFKDVPSMQIACRKTAVSFHAKDDLPEVRYRVFHLLLRHKLKFYAVVRDKRQLLSYVLQQNEKDRAYQYNENELYDSLVSKLFKDRFFKADEFRLCFAKRGKRDRNQSFKNAIEHARKEFERVFGLTSRTTIQISSSTPEQHAGLQAVDYFLWALQRFYEMMGTEKEEDRHLNLVWPKVGLVHDLDDLTGGPSGTYFTKDKPLGLEVKKQKNRRI